MFDEIKYITFMSKVEYLMKVLDNAMFLFFNSLHIKDISVISWVHVEELVYILKGVLYGNNSKIWMIGCI